MFKTLLVGTAIIATVNIAQGADLSMSSDSTWGSNGSHNSSSVDNASAGDNVDIQDSGSGTALTVTNNGTNTDGSTNTNTFSLGNVTNSTGLGNLSIQASAAPLTVNIGSVSTTNGFGIYGYDNNGNTNAASVVVHGNVSVASPIQVYTGASVGTGQNISLTLSGASIASTNTNDPSFNPVIDMSEDPQQNSYVSVLFNGTTAQTVTGSIFGNEGLTGGAAGLIGAGLPTGEVITNNTSASGITFNGDLGYDTNGDAVVLRQLTLAGTGKATFNGVVDATNIIFTGTGTANFNQNILTTDYQSSTLGSFKFNADGTANVADSANVTGNISATGGHIGTLNFLGNSTVTGDIGDAGNTLKVLTVSGTGKTVSVSGNVAAADNTNINGNTLNTAGTFTLGSGQKLSANIDSSSNGEIISTGNAIVNANAKLALTVDTGLTNHEQFTIINGASSGGEVSTLAAGNITALNAGLFNFSQVANADSLIVQANAVTFSGNTGTVQNLLSSLSGTATGQLANIESNLASAPTQAAAKSILESVAPTVNGAAAVAVQSVSAQTQGIADTRMSSIRAGNDGTTGMSAGASGNGISMWVQNYGQSAHQGTRDEIAGYSSTTEGGVVGIDTTNFLDGAIGLSLNFGNTNVNSNNANTTNTKLQNYGANLYDTINLPAHSFVTGQVGFGYNTINNARHDVGGAGSGITASSNYNSEQYSAKVSLGHDFQMAGMILTPLLTANYTGLSTATYSENGAGNASLQNVSTPFMNSLDVGGGINLAFAVTPYIKPSIHAAYSYDVIGDQLQSTASFTGGGSAFTTTGVSPSRSSIDVGAGLLLLSESSWDVSATYDFQYKNGYTANSYILKATTRFE